MKCDAIISILEMFEWKESLSGHSYWWHCIIDYGQRHLIGQYSCIRIRYYVTRTMIFNLKPSCQSVESGGFS